MPVKLEVSEVVDRPLDDVFHFYAYGHVRNHPRWNPDLELEQITDGPIGVGTIIRRRNSMSGTPIEGTMEVTEFEPDRSFAVLIHDGPVETVGRADFESLNQNQTRITISAEFPGSDEGTMNVDLVTQLMKRSATNMKQLIESET
jgi:hypothetical protein